VQEFYYLFVVFLALIISQNTLKVSIHAALRFVHQPLSKNYDILIWKENDRAIASFKSLNEIQENSQMIREIVEKWIEATT
jgi:hypothetical protein